MLDAHCGVCDGSFDQNNMVVHRVDGWHERCACPLCGHIEPQLYLSDDFYGTAFYLLAVADDDSVWPIPLDLPTYEA